MTGHITAQKRRWRWRRSGSRCGSWTTFSSRSRAALSKRHTLDPGSRRWGSTTGAHYVTRRICRPIGDRGKLPHCDWQLKEVYRNDHRDNRPGEGWSVRRTDGGNPQRLDTRPYDKHWAPHRALRQDGGASAFDERADRAGDRPERTVRP